ncbi:neutrophil cytosol factor 1 [Synchiropus picturatus]
MEEIYVRHVKLLGFEKRYFPSKHFVYMLMVKWSDQAEKLVYRTYPQIHTFHKSLKEIFPIESGQIEKRDRIIPSLPAPRWVDSQKSRESRQNTLTEYFDALVALPAHIVRCQLLCSFFKVRPEDESPPVANASATLQQKKSETLVVSEGNVSEISGPILLDSYRVVADFNKTSKHEMNLKTGDLVDIIEKNQNGWWFCQSESKRGWVPASYLEPLDGPEESEDLEPDYEGEPHVTTQAYEAQLEDEISLGRDETIEVIHKLLDGWWVVRKGEQTGYFPSTFLEPVGLQNTEHVNKRPPPRRSTIKNLKSIHGKNRQRLSQDVYRRNSRRFLQQKVRTPTPSPRDPKAIRPSRAKDAESPGMKTELTRTGSAPGSGPVVPPRPSPEVILQRCTDSTRKRVSVHEPVTTN